MDCLVEYKQKYHVCIGNLSSLNWHNLLLDMKKQNGKVCRLRVKSAFISTMSTKLSISNSNRIELFYEILFQ